MGEAILAAALTSALVSGPPVLLDAKCDAAEYANAARHDIGGGVTLRARHDADYVYLCLMLPAQSLGTMDLFLQPVSGGPMYNLHISAQVGERIFAGGAWPDWTFGNERAWYGPPVAFRGMARRPDGTARPDFSESEAREVQLTRARFGNGPWKVRLEVRALGPDKRGEVVFPAGSTDTNSKAWATLPFVG
jgi:hypothetical protein